MASGKDYADAYKHIMAEAGLQIAVIEKADPSRPLDRDEIIDGARDVINSECHEGTLRRCLDYFGEKECRNNLWPWIVEMSAELKRIRGD